MKKVLFTLFLTFFIIDFTYAQVGVNTVTPNAMLDIKASNQATPANTDGILIPKIDAFPAINPTAAKRHVGVSYHVIGRQSARFLLLEQSGLGWNLL
ncbi:MAG: hypothetical protein IPN80_10060 [Flavobacterium sp.]|nr:hypothetical protein [Flavobacterium sp.]